MILRNIRVIGIVFLGTFFCGSSCEREGYTIPSFVLLRVDDDLNINENEFPKMLALDSRSLYSMDFEGEVLSVEAISVEDSSSCYMSFTRSAGVDTDWVYEYYLKKINNQTFILVKGGFASGRLDCQDEAQLNSPYFKYQEYRAVAPNPSP